MYVNREFDLTLPPTASMSLFTPGFGRAPHVFVGRDRAVSEIVDGLRGGPGDDRYISLLLGGRGSGKTVTLALIADSARSSGWLVVSIDASTARIADRIRSEIDAISEEAETVGDLRDRTTTVSKAARLSFASLSVRRETIRRIDTRWDTRRLLTHLGRHAAAAGIGVLIAADELHSAERDDIRRLAADLQHVTMTGGLPVAFLGAGLLDVKNTILADKRITFFHRVPRHGMEPLRRSEIETFLRTTIADAGGYVTNDAAETLLGAASGLPYQMQLLGANAWRLADAPVRTIETHHAHAAVELTRETMDERVHQPAWASLSEAERRMLLSISRQGGNASARDIAADLGRLPNSLHDLRIRLLNLELVSIDDDGSYRFGHNADSDFIAGVRQATDEANALHGPETAEPFRLPHSHIAKRRPLNPRCNEWMPRAQARCILRLGHPGRHKSQ